MPQSPHLELKDPSPRRGAATRELLLAAAERVIARDGAQAASSTAVAAEAGVATGTFYLHFADRDDVLAALFARRLDELVDAVEAQLTADRLLDLGLRGALDGAVRVVLEAYRAHAAVIRTALARVPHDERLRGVYWERHARSLEVVRRFCRRGAAAGLVRGDRPDVVAHTVLVVVQGLNTPLLLGDGAPPALVRGVRRELGGVLEALLRPR